MFLVALLIAILVALALVRFVPRGLLGEAATVAHLSSANQSGPYQPDPGWFALVKQQLSPGEYQPSKELVDIHGKEAKGASWHLDNQAQGFRSAVSRDGWDLGPRTLTQGVDPKDSSKKIDAEAMKNPRKWQWRYRFARLTRGGAHADVSVKDVYDQDGTVFLSYGSGISEWYKNSEAGIEQGFEIQERPHARSDGELVLVGEVRTDLVVTNATREKIAFSQEGVEIFQYAVSRPD